MIGILCWVGLHRWAPWSRTTVSRSNEDGTWSPYEARRCERCNWTQTRVQTERTDTP